MLKLVRLARMPRLIKLLDENRFKRVLQQCDSNDSISSIIRRQRNLAMYKLFRLIMIMILMVYGIACINYLLADYFAAGSEEKEKTFPTYFGLVEKDDSWKLITMMYFSLTVLSTVGYGDYHAVSTNEMILAIVIMLMGVAVFSWI